jgi:pimeloyl-ACP methyl ester carboxylesterase
MARTDINGVGIEYELVGEVGRPAVALTPGGRFAMDSPGLPELAQQLAAGGRRVLLWDRPNCGLSDPCFDGTSESGLHADTLIQLIRQLDLGPTALAAGSAGSRVSLMTAARYPDEISHLAVWWITGGLLGMISLASYYCVAPAMVAAREGMEPVTRMPVWAEQVQRNPKARQILLDFGAERFVQAMERWAPFYLGSADSPVPGMTSEDFARLRMPVRIYQNGLSDLSHTRATTDWVHKMIPGSELLDPPWDDQEWNIRSAYGIKTGAGHFAGWPALAPGLLAFLEK